MDAQRPRPGRHYPRSTGKFQSWFATDADCGKRTSVIAGTLFDWRRTPLAVWFTACGRSWQALDGTA